jgi:hypothetical protein
MANPIATKIQFRASRGAETIAAGRLPDHEEGASSRLVTGLFDARTLPVLSVSERLCLGCVAALCGALNRSEGAPLP